MKKMLKNRNKGKTSGTRGEFRRLGVMIEAVHGKVKTVKKKIDVDEFALLERRVAALEKRR